MVEQLDLGGIKIEVLYKDIKNVHLSVYPPKGRVRISAPKRMRSDRIRIFAISKLGAESRVFIDGRFEAVYPPQVIGDYFAFMNGTPGWERLLDAYPTDVVVVQRWRNIHPRLFAHPDFVYVYSDPASLVFVRRTPANDETLLRLASLPDRNDFPHPATVFP